MHIVLCQDHANKTQIQAYFTIPNGDQTFHHDQYFSSLATSEKWRFY